MCSARVDEAADDPAVVAETQQIVAYDLDGGAFLVFLHRVWTTQPKWLPSWQRKLAPELVQVLAPMLALIL
jgi:hypothetical protein